MNQENCNTLIEKINAKILDFKNQDIDVPKAFLEVVLNFLEDGNYEKAKAKCSWDGDKIMNYPETEKFLRKIFELPDYSGNKDLEKYY